MSFISNVDIQNRYYGRWKKQKTAPAVFVQYGKAVIIENITRDIETDKVKITLSFIYLGEKVYLEIDRKNYADYALLQELSDAGADVPRQHFDVFIDSLRWQEEQMEANGYGAEKVYTHLGWKSMPKQNVNGERVGTLLCYRADKMLGAYNAKYTGDLKVSPMGNYETWKAMVANEVLGTPVLEFLLLMGLAAVTNGLIAPYTTGENPIVHICGPSGGGKTTIAMLLASTAGEPFDGERRIQDRYGTPLKLQSVYGSWSATENATIGRCSGNRGSVVVLNELGKFKGNDMSSIVYNFSEGTDKVRLTKDLKPYQAEGYTTTFISVGEISLIERCKSKAAGIRTRVMELDGKLTTSAAQANRIKAVCRRHNGWAAPMLAEYIIENGGINMVLQIYDKHRSNMTAQWPDTPSRERFVEKFVVLVLTTAELAEEALGITFDQDAVVDFLKAYDLEHGAERAAEASSYDVLMAEFRVNIANFYRGKDYVPPREVWGRISKINRVHTDGRIILEEYLVRKNVVEKLLKQHGFNNKKTCTDTWTAAELISRDTDRPTRSRRIDPTLNAPEEVYVFRVFEEIVQHRDYTLDVTAAELPPEPLEEVKRYKAKSQLASLLKEDEDNDEDVVSA